MDGSLVPAITQCLGSYTTPVTWISGTSKTKDTYLEGEWQASSQGVWHVKCDACGFVNVCAVEPEGHMLAMIGPYRDDISERHPGTVCHRCRRPVNPRYGQWVHRYPERRAMNTGFFAPQIIFPFHFASPAKWQLLVAYMNGRHGYTTAKFYNEVLGEAYDQAYKLVSIDDLKAAATLGPNTRAEAARRCTKYQTVVLGVDWGGGGDDGVSRTKGAAVGLTPDGVADVFFGFAFQPSTDRIAEAKEILQLARLCRAQLIAHDAGGGIGTASEAALVHFGWPERQLVPMVYQGTYGSEMVQRHPPRPHETRGHYSLHKSKTLQFLAMAIRYKRVRFFQYDYQDVNDPGLLHDFLALVEDKVDTPTGGTYRIRRASKTMSDDFSAATNYATACLWEYTNSWPGLVTAGAVHGAGR